MTEFAATIRFIIVPGSPSFSTKEARRFLLLTAPMLLVTISDSIYRCRVVTTDPIISGLVIL